MANINLCTRKLFSERSALSEFILLLHKKKSRSLRLLPCSLLVYIPTSVASLLAYCKSIIRFKFYYFLQFQIEDISVPGMGQEPWRYLASCNTCGTICRKTSECDQDWCLSRHERPGSGSDRQFLGAHFARWERSRTRTCCSLCDQQQFLEVDYPDCSPENIILFWYDYKTWCAQ